MVKILDFKCMVLLTKTYCIYVFFIYICLEFHQIYFSIKLLCNIDDFKSKYLMK